MAHTEQLKFIKGIAEAFPGHFYKSRVLEIGSLDINGSVRPFFDCCDYIGIDLGEGPGVDIVCNGAEYTSTEKFDVVVSTECFEHAPEWDAIFINMIHLTRPGGLVLFTCASAGRPEHGTARTSPADSPFTGNYYRNLIQQDFDLLSPKTYFFTHDFQYQYPPGDLYFYGIRNAERVSQQHTEWVQ